MRLVYLGTPEASVPPLLALHEAGHEVVLVVTQADKKRGRGSALSPSPVKAAANSLGLPVSHRVKDVVDVDADLGVVVAFGRLIKPDVLDRLDFVNVHFSLLPRWRGAAPVERAILAGDQETGVCLMKLEEGLDTGPVYARVVTPIGTGERADELRERLVDMGSRLLVQTLAEGLGEPVPQVGEATHAAKLQPGDFRIDWQKAAVEIDRLIRVGKAWTTFRGKRLILHEVTVADDFALVPGEYSNGHVGTGDGSLRLVTVQPEGKPRLDAPAWVNGSQPAAGETLN